MDERFRGLPGEELVARGLADLAAGLRTDEALLVSVGAPRLRACGVEVPPWEGEETPEISLYLQLRERHGKDAHSRYNALIRRLVSFERGLERRAFRRTRPGRQQ